MTPDEIFRLGDNMIILTEKRNPILGHKFAWYLNKDMINRVYNTKDLNSYGSKHYPPLDRSERILNIEGEIK